MPHIKTHFVRTPSLLLPRLLCGNKWFPGITKRDLPSYPKVHTRLFFRIRGGFNASRFTHFQLSKLLSTAAGFPATMELRQDIITVNPTTNTVTLSTERYDRLTKYLAIKSLMVNSQEHEVTSYSVPNSETCKGIIYIDRVWKKLSLKKTFYPRFASATHKCTFQKPDFWEKLLMQSS
ncbi:hypothetical protein HPB50_002385 [Hyalomma asiaticum]|uniref:Uncharacterized protein n=1 Tax=Hyalomma asiaticum TaxID=266040 RepID=A0ACB7TB58_HYAAI|nr:hypothetical protein HPB50_002385 [Hyalomma asiaticum]